MENTPKNATPKNAALIRIKPTDFVLGGLDAFIGSDQELYSDGHLAYLPENEAQIGIYFDTFGCVSFSANNAIETDGNKKITDNIFSRENIEWLKNPTVDGVSYPSYIQRGRLNFSDRDLTVMSETIPDLGNYLDKVADTARNKGLIPEAMASWDFRNRDPRVNSKENYYSYKRTPEAEALAGEFLRRFEIRYRVVFKNSFNQESKNRIIQIISCGQRGFRNGKFFCPNQPNGHAMMLARYSDISILDHYEPFLKNFESKEDLNRLGMSFSIIEKNMNTQKPIINDNTLIQLVSGSGGFGLYLNGNIIVDDLDKILASWLVRNNGNLSGRTRALVKEQWDLFPKVNLKMERIK